MNDSKKLSALLQTICAPLNYTPKLLIVRILRMAAQRWFWVFCMCMPVKPKPYMMTKFHFHLCNTLQRLFESIDSGKDFNIDIEVQPQIGKSTTASELFPAWVLGKRPWPIIVASYGASLAEVKSSNCRDIVSSENYQMIFPHVRLHPETAAKEYWKTTTGGSYRAAGVGGPITGNPGMVLIGDDLFKDQTEANSQTVRENTWGWFMTVFLSRKQDPSAVLLVNTRWHRDDVAGRVEKKFNEDKLSGKALKEFDQWEFLRFPAFATEDEYIDGKLFRKQGEVLCPERFGYDSMVRRKNATAPYEWAALYMQTPILKENARFREEWFRYYKPEDIEQKDIVWFVFVDPASSKKAGSDNTVVRAVGKERTTGIWYLGDEIAGLFDAGQQVDALFKVVKQYPGARAWIEGVAYQRTLEYWVNEKQRKDGFFFNVDLLERKQVQSKEDRIEGLVPLYKNNLIFHRNSGADKDYEMELLAFPQGKHDDRIDAVSFALDVVPNTTVPETPQQKKAREKEEKVVFDPFASISKI